MYTQLKEELARREAAQQNVEKLLPLVRYMENPVSAEEFPHVKSIAYAHDFGESPLRMTLYVKEALTAEQYASLRANVAAHTLLQSLALDVHIVHEDDDGNRYDASNLTKQHTETLVANHADVANVTLESSSIICMHLAQGCSMQTLSTEQVENVYELGFLIAHNVFSDSERGEAPLVYTEDGV